jgi:hypothetical protein
MVAGKRYSWIETNGHGSDASAAARATHPGAAAALADAGAHAKAGTHAKAENHAEAGAHAKQKQRATSRRTQTEAPQTPEQGTTGCREIWTPHQDDTRT